MEWNGMEFIDGRVRVQGEEMDELRRTEEREGQEGEGEGEGEGEDRSASPFFTLSPLHTEKTKERKKKVKNQKTETPAYEIPSRLPSLDDVQ